MRARLLTAIVAMAFAASACASSQHSLIVGAMYPTGGGQGPGGTDELRGVQLAADLVNSQGGVHGRRIHLDLVATDSADAVPHAMDKLTRDGARVVLGSYGSTMSAVAASIAARRDMVFWETGAVGLLPQVASGHVFRVPPTGETLGRVAVDFVTNVYLPKTKKKARPRYGVTYVDDVYGRSVGRGAVEAIRSAGENPEVFPYDARRTDFAALARRIGAARINVLVVGAYLEDGVALRRAVVRQQLPLIANIGTSSSYCMPEFGKELGRDAVGAFASDKPDADSVSAKALLPDAARRLRWAQDNYRRRFGVPMTAPALAGFSGAWALFGHVLPAASSASAGDVVRAARTVRIPDRGLPNGSGLAFAPSTSVSENLRAASVVWEWVAPGTRAIVWPPAFATRPIVAEGPGGAAPPVE